MNDTEVMPRGAFVMLDVLGFKGIWRRPEVREDPSKVLRKLEGIVKLAKQHALERVGGEQLPHGLLEQTLDGFEVTLVSDTIAAGLTLKESRVERAARSIGTDKATLSYAGLAVTAAGHFVEEVIRAAAELPIPLALRGAISFGRFAMGAQCMVGPAVDEAAECAELPDAAIVCCAPSARRTLDGRLNIQFGQGPLVPWTVPLKGKGPFNTFAVAPFDVDKNVALAVWSAIEPTFYSAGLDVELKRQRSAEFFERAIRAFPETQELRKKWTAIARKAMASGTTMAPTVRHPDESNNRQSGEPTS